MKNFWICERCLKILGDIEILTIANIFDEKCVVCNYKGKYCVKKTSVEHLYQLKTKELQQIKEIIEKVK